ncbi:hypothetical protein PINS_up007296 [Pythium insidiosum]|nr:hypothetical protein PINS_up007296 [Pythium insidiosum]
MQSVPLVLGSDTVAHVPVASSSNATPVIATVENAAAATLPFDGSSASVHSNHVDPTPTIDRSCARLCHFKLCKKVTKTETDVVVRCDNDTCSHLEHRACSARMQIQFGDGDSVTSVVCGKRCFNAVLKAAREMPTDNTIKKPVMWHNDGHSPSVSSLSCLIDWLTTGDNYSRFRGGPGQTGETKTGIAHEIARFIEDSGISTVRTAKDILTKIAAIESSFKKAADWLSNTGQGVTDEGCLKAAILSRCPYYYVLYDVMINRSTTKPLMLSTDTAAEVTDDDEEVDDGDHESADETASSDRSSAKSTCRAKRPSTTPLSVVKNIKKSKHVGYDIDPSLIELRKTQMQHELELKRQKLTFQQVQVDLHREDMELRKTKSESEARESSVRIAESAAKAEKLRHEGEHWRLQVHVTLLRERKRLLEEGILQTDIDKLLPLPT